MKAGAPLNRFTAFASVDSRRPAPCVLRLSEVLVALGATGRPRERRLGGTMTAAAGLRANLGAIAFFALCNCGEAAESVQFSTGNGLYHLCTQGTANLSGVRVDLSRRFAGYYIQGAHDFMALQSSSAGEKAAWCLPRNVTTDQLTDVVCAYLRPPGEALRSVICGVGSLAPGVPMFQVTTLRC